MAGELEVGFEDGVREVHVAERVGAGGGGVGVRVGVGEELVGVRADGGGRHSGDGGGMRSPERNSSGIVAVDHEPATAASACYVMLLSIALGHSQTKISSKSQRRRDYIMDRKMQQSVFEFCPMFNIQCNPIRNF